MTTRGGINYNEKTETSLKGLFAAGDEYFGGISAAATFGWIAGENASAYIKRKKAPQKNAGNKKLEEIKTLAETFRNRKSGASWQEVNVALQQVMFDYAGIPRSDTLLEAGAVHLQKVKQKAFAELAAANQHELAHCLEVINLLDVAEVVFASISARKETRDKYTRIDHPYKNPSLNNKVLICKKGETGPLTTWKETNS